MCACVCQGMKFEIKTRKTKRKREKNFSCNNAQSRMKLSISSIQTEVKNEKDVHYG